MKGNRVFIVGVGMTKFLKPGSHDMTYIDLGKQAIERALKDSSLSYDKVEEAYVGYVFQSSCAGQRVLYEVGMTGIPVVNVNNNCATGSTAFNLAYNSVKYGKVSCALALGFDQMQKGPLPMEPTQKNHPVYKYAEPLLRNNTYNPKIPSTPQIFGAAGKEYMEKYELPISCLYKISVKNYNHGFNNPYAQFRKQYNEAEVEKSSMICYPLNKLQCCPTSDGAACVIVCDEKFVIDHNLQNQAVEILTSVLCTDKELTFSSNSMINIVGGDLTRRTAEQAYKNAGITSKDIQVVELHDCFSANELITYEGLGLCEKGKAKEFIECGNNTYGGKYVVNPSGGLTSKGHPLGATGIAQVTELTWQLRGIAEKRQVKDAKYALSHNLGLGSALVVSIFKKYNDNYEKKPHHTSDPDSLKKIEKDRLKNTKLANKMRSRF
jgi:sterol carrier protein 2